MSDRAHLIETKTFEPKFFEKQYPEYAAVQYSSLINSSQTADRSGFQTVFKQFRQQPSLRPLGFKRSRYHGPGGNEYRAQDFADVLNSRAKVSDYMNQTISVNPGAINMTVG